MISLRLNDRSREREKDSLLLSLSLSLSLSVWGTTSRCDQFWCEKAFVTFFDLCFQIVFEMEIFSAGGLVVE